VAPRETVERSDDGPAAALRERLAAVADPSGFIPFDRFMETALYADGVGYYARSGGPLGPSGDFYTAPHVDPLFGESLARRLRSVRATLPRPERFRVVELGPGDGTLAASVITGLRPAEGIPPVDYVLVERSPGLRARAREHARASAERTGGSVEVADSLAALGPVQGAVIANEFLDAQPARRLQWSGHGWAELGVRLEGGRVVPAHAPVTEPVPGPPLPRADEPGTVVEVSPAAEAAVREIADHLAAGLCVLIDYGMDEPELLAAHPRGTLEAVRGHRSLPDPLEAPGQADLSAFVNFRRIRAAARAAGLVEVAFERQAEALGRWGFPVLLEEALRTAPSPAEAVRRRLAAKNLLFGFDRFQVLELAAAASAPALVISPGEEDRA